MKTMEQYLMQEYYPYVRTAHENLCTGKICAYYNVFAFQALGKEPGPDGISEPYSADIVRLDKKIPKLASVGYDDAGSAQNALNPIATAINNGIILPRGITQNPAICVVTVMSEDKELLQRMLNPFNGMGYSQVWTNQTGMLPYIVHCVFNESALPNRFIASDFGLITMVAGADVVSKLWETEIDITNSFRDKVEALQHMNGELIRENKELLEARNSLISEQAKLVKSPNQDGAKPIWQMFNEL